MDNPNPTQTLNPKEPAALPCNETVAIPRDRYDDLIRAERELGILRSAYQTMSSFSMDYIMDAIFDPRLKY